MSRFERDRLGGAEIDGTWATGTQLLPACPVVAGDEEIAYRLQVCVETVRNWRNRGLLPPRTKIFGGLERYQSSESSTPLKR